MYLNKLNKEQKELFLDLCINAAEANKEFAVEEKQLIEQYCEEMRLAEVRLKSNHDFESAVLRLTEISSKAELRMMLLEITALVLTDGEFDKAEKDFIDRFVESTGMNCETFDEMKQILTDLSRIYQKIEHLIFEE